MMKTKAFTVLEIMVVVIIVGVLAAVIMPQYRFAKERVIAAEADKTIRTILKAARLYYYEHGEYPDADADLGIDYSKTSEYFSPAFVFNGENPGVLFSRSKNGSTLYQLTGLVSDTETISCGEVKEGWCEKLGFGESSFVP